MKDAPTSCESCIFGDTFMTILAIISKNRPWTSRQHTFYIS